MNGEQCFICGQGNPHTLEEHHAVPRRYNGSNQPENLYHLCGSCHNAVEAIYDDEFYERLGIATSNPELLSHTDVSGEVVDPRQSKGRKIPAHLEDVEYEPWLHTVTVNDLAAVNKGAYDGKHCEFLSNHVSELLGRYADELDKVLSYYEMNEEKYEGTHPAISFVYEHGEMAKVPPIQVYNPNYINRPNSPPPNTQLQRSDNTEKTLLQSKENYPNYYRLHCGYCHTVFSQYQHEDLARHLQLKHGIDVWEQKPVSMPLSPTQQGDDA